jgi:hypothetical protein
LRDGRLIRYLGGWEEYYTAHSVRKDRIS